MYKTHHRTGESSTPRLETGRPLVLVVDDHDDTRFLLRTVMEMRGLDVLEACDGEEAISLAERERPDLILMDTSLPRLDGLAATRRMRERASLGSVPIIFLSGHAQPSVRVAAFEAGCNGYLVKPLDLNQLNVLLETHLSRKESGDGDGKGVSNDEHAGF